MPFSPEEAYEEALRRIRQAKETGALELDLSGLALNRLPRELARLTSLQSPNLAECWQLSGNLSPLARLTSLRSLGLDQCRSTIWLRLDALSESIGTRYEPSPHRPRSLTSNHANVGA